MEYDPIKKSLGRMFSSWRFSRRLFYLLLDILLLRTWHVHKQLRQFFRANQHKSGLAVLDAGSGFGQYSYFIARHQPDWSVLGIDIKEDEVGSCQSFFHRSGIRNARFEVQDLTKYVSADTYDLIISVDVMEHILEDQQVFSNFFNSLKDNGVLLINTPSDKGGSGVSHQGESSFIGEHVRDGYNMEDIGHKLKQAGFSDIQMGYTYGWTGNISWHLSMKYPILLLGVSKLFLILLPLYYLLVMPVVLVLNTLDVNRRHQTGTGLLVRAKKQVVNKIITL